MWTSLTMIATQWPKNLSVTGKKNHYSPLNVINNIFHNWPESKKIEEHLFQAWTALGVVGPRTLLLIDQTSKTVIDIFSKHEPRGGWLAEGCQDGDDRAQEQVHQENAQGGHVQVNSFSCFPSLSNFSRSIGSSINFSLFRLNLSSKHWAKIQSCHIFMSFFDRRCIFNLYTRNFLDKKAKGLHFVLVYLRYTATVSSNSALHQDLSISS